MSRARRAPRALIKERADALGVDADELLILSRQNDPFWTGTDADHAKAEWFAELYEKAVADREDDRIHVRGVHYSTVMLDERVEPPTDQTSWDEYRNTETCWSYLAEAAKVARVLGYVDLDKIQDEKNDQRTVTEYGEHVLRPDLRERAPHAGVVVPNVPRVDDRATVDWDDDPAEYVAQAIARAQYRGIHVDTARQRPYHVEMWSEKALPEPVKAEARRYNVNVLVEGEGQLSYSVAGDFARRVNDAEKPAVVFYLSDFDPVGDEMAAAMASKLEWATRTGKLDHRVVVKQLAIRQDQIAEYGLGPRTPISVDATTDAGDTNPYATKVTDWEERKGAGAVELNVLETDLGLFKRLVREALQPLRDGSRFRKNSEAEREYREHVREVARSNLDAEALRRRGEAVEEWVERFNGSLSEAEAVLERLHDLRHGEGSAYKDWLEAVEDAIGEVAPELPAFDPPELDADLPAAPLYDSARAYDQTVAEVRRHERGERGGHP